jgi:uncharacterized protein YjeT (DUF2065 family)
MIILVRLFGILIVGFGIIFLIDPKAMKAYIAFWEPKKRLRIGAIISFLAGIIFLSAAAQAKLPGVIVTLGIVSLIKGVLLFLLGPEKIKSMMNWWSQKSDSFIRRYALFALAVGMLIIYST